MDEEKKIKIKKIFYDLRENFLVKYDENGKTNYLFVRRVKNDKLQARSFGYLKKISIEKILSKENIQISTWFKPAQ